MAHVWLVTAAPAVWAATSLQRCSPRAIASSPRPAIPPSGRSGGDVWRSGAHRSPRRGR